MGNPAPQKSAPESRLGGDIGDPFDSSEPALMQETGNDREPGNYREPDNRREPVNYPYFDDDMNVPYDRYEEPAGRRENLSYDRSAPEDSIPRVNMLANLINWVSRAKQEIGSDQLSVFLEVYGISGHLSPELKDIIMHLAEITGDKSPANSSAGIWSESLIVPSRDN
jgi:hypothetical protein